MSDNENGSTFWCRKFSFEVGQVRHWQVGPLTLVVQCLKGEWMVGHERQQEFAEYHGIEEVSVMGLLPSALANNARYVFRETTRVLSFSPQLADRPVISRPETPIFLTAGEEATLYVSTPLWINLKVGASQPRQLAEVPIQRPSDTWFGPSTREGKLCYSTMTHCRINLDVLVYYEYRAITPIRILNRADTTLAIERLNLPAPLLPLYASSNGLLWTPRVTLKREDDGELAELIIDQSPPKEAQRSKQIAVPREDTHAGALFRAFNAVFS